MKHTPLLISQKSSSVSYLKEKTPLFGGGGCTDGHRRLFFEVGDELAAALARVGVEQVLHLRWCVWHFATSLNSLLKGLILKSPFRRFFCVSFLGVCTLFLDGLSVSCSGNLYFHHFLGLQW